MPPPTGCPVTWLLQGDARELERLEKSNLGRSVLTGDVRDAELFKMRRGRVGGYPKYLSEGQEYAANAPAELDPRCGYSF